MSATGLLAAAEAHSVSFLPGDLFYARPVADKHVRLSYSMFEPAVLVEAARRFGQAFTACAS
jgi:DNA-binding transcriptional MocR family regulator